MLLARDFAGRPSAYLLSNLKHCVLLQLVRIAIEAADAFGQFLGGHGIFVVHPAESLLIQMQALFLERLRMLGVERAIQFELDGALNPDIANR